MLSLSHCLAPDGQPFQLFTLSNRQGMQILLTDWGATWCSAQLAITTQMGEVELRELLCGCKIEHLADNQAYLGATIGRFANRIAHGKFSLAGKNYQLPLNQKQRHCLHGGKGFDQRRWKVEHNNSNSVTFSLFSADGDQGFAGNLWVKVKYHLTDENQVSIEFSAISDQTTPLNLTNHAYFNLDNKALPLDIRYHQLQLFADYYLPVDAEGIPNAPLTSVTQTNFDFRQAKILGQDLLQDLIQQKVNGYDHSFLLQETENLDLKPAANLISRDQKVELSIYTTQPAIQVYTANFFAGTPNFKGEKYQNHCAVALETQALPDTPNHPEWFKYGGISLANQPYHQKTIFAFKRL
ncbi:galactose-1-epimerase [Mergibacter septicus]|uniref:galactose-1-epimerase n=1 Tax=Mergibacter septicus TaxID=221402 RepID=UPI0011791521|nr:galactose-1-epimerase [Mergibacter septicus]AWX13598.1 galactose-1-epimerase [Mergibacter septicus]